MRRADLLRTTLSSDQVPSALSALAASYAAASTSLLHSRGEDCYRAQFIPTDGSVSPAGRVAITVLARPSAGGDAPGNLAGKGPASATGDKDDDDEEMK